MNIQTCSLKLLRLFFFFLSWNLKGVVKVIKSQTYWFLRPEPLKTVLVCKIPKNDVITLKFSKTIELIKCNVCVKYEPSTKWTKPEIKERFMTSSLQGFLKPDSKNTDQLIKTAVVNLLSWNFQDWLGTIMCHAKTKIKQNTYTSALTALLCEDRGK